MDVKMLMVCNVSTILNCCIDYMCLPALSAKLSKFSKAPDQEKIEKMGKRLIALLCALYCAIALFSYHYQIPSISAGLLIYLAADSCLALNEMYEIQARKNNDE